MGPTVRLRATSSRIVGATACAFALFGIGSLAATGEWDAVVTYGPWLGLVGLVGWAGYWTPYVEVSDGGVRMRNVIRTVDVAWPAIQDVEGRFGLRLATAYGKLAAWAVPAPAGRSRRGVIESDAATVVRDRLEELRILGFLADPKLESARPRVHWHVPEIAAGAALLVLALLAAVT